MRPDFEEPQERINDESLDIDENSVTVLKNCGPKGYPGMAEVGNMPLPPKVLRKGISDMVRVSDARMSGTAYGNVVLHAAPEAAAGGPLALAQTCDWVTLHAAGRKLSLEVSDADLARRKVGWTPPKPPIDRGYWKLHIDDVFGAHLDFLVGNSGMLLSRESHCCETMGGA